MMKSSFIKTAVIILMLSLMGGCAAKNGQDQNVFTKFWSDLTSKFKKEDEEKKVVLLHTVKYEGETFAIISRWYTGEYDNWKKLAKKNSDIDPYRLERGDKIRIPEELLKTKKALPKWYVEKYSPKKAKPEKAYITHEVTWPGETLSLIAKWYTGKYVNWRDIAGANPGLDPQKVDRGDVIKIPKKLLTTRRAMPKSFVDKHTSPSPGKEEPDESAPEPMEEEDEEMELFGPKGI